MIRSPLTNEPPLLEPERAIRLVEDATARLREPREHDDYDLARLAARSILDASLVALETSIDTGDPRVLAAALELATLRARSDSDPLERELALAAARILPAVSEITNTVRDCARSRSRPLRAATARGLGPRALRSMKGEGDEVDAEAAGIVFALAKDEDAGVRKAARDALGGAAPPAWAALFSRDPLASRSAGEAARLRAPLDRAAEALEAGLRRGTAPLREAIAELPDDLAGPILDAWIRTPGAARHPGVEPLLDRWLSLDPDGERVVAWLRALPEGFSVLTGKEVAPALARSPHALAIATRVVRALFERTIRRFDAVEIAEELVAHGWPDDADPTPLLELALGAPLASAAEPDPSASDALSESHGPIVSAALAPRRAFDAITEPLVAAFLADFPGRWKRVARDATERLVSVRHPSLRAHAEALLRSAEGAPLTWALRHLTDGGHDPALDPPPAVFLREAVRDPRLRAAVMAHGALREAALDVLRQQLASGELSPADAITLATSLLGPTVATTLTADEWAAVRRARAALGAPDESATALLALPPVSEWTDEDRAFVEACALHADDGGVGVHLAIALRHRAAPELVPILERALERAGSPAADLLRRTISICREARS